MNQSEPQKVYKLAYFVSHPIQYQAPLLKLLSQQPDIQLEVFFLSDISIRPHRDEGFGTQVKWDVPLLDGYKHQFLEATFSDSEFSLFNPKVRISSVKRALKSGNWDAVWIHGYANMALLYVIWFCTTRRIPLLFRGESNLTCTPSGPVKNLFVRTLIKLSSGLLYIGNDNRDYYRHYGANEDKLFFMPYTVDNDFFRAQNIAPKATGSEPKGDAIIILYASKFVKRKNPLLLLHAFDRLEQQVKIQSRLWFIGDGEMRQQLEDDIAERNLQQYVSVLGFKNQTELPYYYSLCDVFVLPSEQEPFGLVIKGLMVGRLRQIQRPIWPKHCRKRYPIRSGFRLWV